jgi:hypothetical protein
MAAPDEERRSGGRRSGPGTGLDGEEQQARKSTGESAWRDASEAPWDDEEYQPLGSESSRPAPLGLDRDDRWGDGSESASSVAVLERTGDERRPVDALREAERLLCDLCTRVEDGELWEEIRTVRDLVREAVGLMA